jgi:hypothetical protein
MKNRYCRRTKLSEKEFLSILSAYCAGLTATEAAKANAAVEKPASRQTVERIFLQLGNYLYERYVRTIFVELAKRNPERLSDVDESERIVLDRLWDAMRGDLDYAYFRNVKLPFPGGDELLLVLKRRWAAFNGFTRDKFPAHLAYAVYQLLDDKPFTLRARLRRYENLTELLEKDPL